MRFGRVSAVAWVAVMVGLLGGCASFDSRWKEAGARSPGHGLEGRWEGTWTSLNNGSSDALRCVITRVNDHTCHAVMHATINGAFYFDHTVELEVKPTSQGFSFHGMEDNPWYKGGKCWFTGQSAGDQVRGTYLDKLDHGTFEVARVGGREKSKSVKE